MGRQAVRERKGRLNGQDETGRCVCECGRRGAIQRCQHSQSGRTALYFHQTASCQVQGDGVEPVPATTTAIYILHGLHTQHRLQAKRAGPGVTVYSKNIRNFVTDGRNEFRMPERHSATGCKTIVISQRSWSHTLGSEVITSGCKSSPTL